MAKTPPKNKAKIYISSTLTAVGMMCCSGSLLQSFLLYIGVNEQNVYLHSSLITAVQAIVMFLLIFFAGKIRSPRIAKACSYLLLIVMAVAFLVGALLPKISKTYLLWLFIASAVSYVGYGAYSIFSYVVPYQIMDMREYGKVTSISSVVSGAVTFGLSFLHAYLVSALDYKTLMAWCFVLSAACFLLTAICDFMLKEIAAAPQQKQTGIQELIAVFKNKDVYALLVPNFARGLSMGVYSVVAVLAISKNVVDKTSAAYITVLTYLATMGGNLLLSFLFRKIKAKPLLLISTLGASVTLPLLFSGGKAVFFSLLFLTTFFRIIVDTCIPVSAAEIIPQSQIGGFTSIRMLVFMAATSVSTLIISLIQGWVGTTGLLIFAVAMQLICGAGYYAVLAARTKAAPLQDK